MKIFFLISVPTTLPIYATLLFQKIYHFTFLFFNLHQLQYVSSHFFGLSVSFWLYSTLSVISKFRIIFKLSRLLITIYKYTTISILISCWVKSSESFHHFLIAKKLNDQKLTYTAGYLLAHFVFSLWVFFLVISFMKSKKTFDFHPVIYLQLYTIHLIFQFYSAWSNFTVANSLIANS